MTKNISKKGYIVEKDMELDKVRGIINDSKYKDIVPKNQINSDMSKEDGLLRIKEPINQRTFNPNTLLELIYGKDRCEKFKKRSQELMEYWIDRLEKEKKDYKGTTISDESRKQLVRNIINEYNDIKNRKVNKHER